MRAATVWQNGALVSGARPAPSNPGASPVHRAGRPHQPHVPAGAAQPRIDIRSEQTVAVQDPASADGQDPQPAVPHRRRRLAHQARRPGDRVRRASTTRRRTPRSSRSSPSGCSTGSRVGAQPSEAGAARSCRKTGDWQKFKGLPPPAEPLKVAPARADRTAVYEAEAKAAAGVAERRADQAGQEGRAEEGRAEGRGRAKAEAAKAKAAEAEADGRGRRGEAPRPRPRRGQGRRRPRPPSRAAPKPAEAAAAEAAAECRRRREPAGAGAGAQA